ncbi:MAG: Uma2 family endonuclease [Vulcanimicrobiaceae bacterium]
MGADPMSLTADEFVAWELRQEAKHEFADGRTRAFAGGTLAHAVISSELLGILRAHPRSRPCRVFGSDVLIATARSRRYADVVVSCDERDIGDLTQTTIRFPTLVVEVPSQSTASVDRSEKFDEYRTIETLQEYLLLDSRKRWAEAYRRNGEEWVSSLPVSSGTLRVASLDLPLDLDELYERASVTAAG